MFFFKHDCEQHVQNLDWFLEQNTKEKPTNKDRINSKKRDTKLLAKAADLRLGSNSAKKEFDEDEK